MTSKLSAPVASEESLCGWTFNLQRFSTEDGPGIRTAVFLKGCPLRCLWCHNPEGLHRQPELLWYETRCLGDQLCLETCTHGVLERSGEGMKIERDGCLCCGDCTRACPAGALELIGQPWSPEQLLAEVEKDRVFYETSAGGVTFTGGEPMMQADFLAATLPLCHQAKLHIALDTSGLAPWNRYEPLLPFLDLVLYDLKILDKDKHKEATGASNDLILQNARNLAQQDIPLWVRTPLVPGYTDDPNNIRSLAQWIASELPSVQRWDLLAYTPLGRPKYQRLGLPYLLEEVPLMSRQEVEQLWKIAVELVPVAQWSGETKR